MAHLARDVGALSEFSLLLQKIVAVYILELNTVCMQGNHLGIGPGLWIQSCRLSNCFVIVRQESPGIQGSFLVIFHETEIWYMLSGFFFLAHPAEELCRAGNGNLHHYSAILC